MKNRNFARLATAVLLIRIVATAKNAAVASHWCAMTMSSFMVLRVRVAVAVHPFPDLGDAVLLEPLDALPNPALGAADSGGDVSRAGVAPARVVALERAVLRHPGLLVVELKEGDLPNDGAGLRLGLLILTIRVFALTPTGLGTYCIYNGFTQEPLLCG